MSVNATIRELPASSIRDFHRGMSNSVVGGPIGDMNTETSRTREEDCVNDNGSPCTVYPTMLMPPGAFVAATQHRRCSEPVLALSRPSSTLPLGSRAFEPELREGETARPMGCCRRPLVGLLRSERVTSQILPQHPLRFGPPTAQLACTTDHVSVGAGLLAAGLIRCRGSLRRGACIPDHPRAADKSSPFLLSGGNGGRGIGALARR